MGLGVVSVADAITSELRRRLLDGQYEAGQELRDTELSEEFGAARPTVRAAVAMLVSDGLLERGRGRSARVRYFTAADAVDLYRLRGAIESAAVRLVIDNKRDLGGVDVAVADFVALPDDVSWDRVADCDIAFHRAVMQASDSDRLLRTFDEVGAELRLMIAQLRPAYRGAKELAAEHAALLDLLRAGRIRPALAAWTEHLSSAQSFFIDLIKQRDQPGAAVAGAIR
jgi:DNA-binding GntR family transcriptional regulator